MIPPPLIRLSELRAQDVLREAEHERLVEEASGGDQSGIIVTAVFLVAIVALLVSALMLRSILIYGGYGFL
jgi:hypothetical protein